MSFRPEGGRQQARAPDPLGAEVAPLIDPVRLVPLLGDLSRVFDVDALASCASTNAVLLERASQGAASGSVLVADHQTAGRGRRGRAWVSSPEASLTFSLLWRPVAPSFQPGGLSLVIGLAVVEALHSLGVSQLGLKWPNDILGKLPAGEGKLGGILLELATDRRGLSIVIGIGLNLGVPEVKKPGVPLAALSLLGSPPPDRHVLLAALLRSLHLHLLQFEQAGFSAFRAAWQAHHCWQGREVALLGEGGMLLHEGKCLGVDTEGALLLQTATGIQRFLVGDVSLRPR